MRDDQAIIRPIKGKKAPDVGPVAVLVSAPSDLHRLRRRMGFPSDGHTNLMISQVFPRSRLRPGVSVAGPMIGAPYATLVLEALISWGAKEILYFGSCGAISPDVRVGDLIIPTGSVVDEGTSPHYAGPIDLSRPDNGLVDRIREGLRRGGRSFHEGLVWTTDAVYRETRDQVRRHQDRGVLGVEMEISAMFTVGAFRGVRVGGLLVVSDELSGLTWKPGFKDDRYAQSREAAVGVIDGICQQRQ